MAGVGVHSKDAIKERASEFFGMGHKMVTSQRMAAIVDAATLHVATGADLPFGSQNQIRRWVRKAVKVKNRSDPSKDMWGKPMRFRYRGGRLRIVSAGPDGRFGNRDDIKVLANLYDY